MDVMCANVHSTATSLLDDVYLKFAFILFNVSTNL